MKRLLRDAVADLLPATIANRTQVTEFSSLVRHMIVRGYRDQLRRIMHEGEWLSAPYVDRAAARAMFDKFDDSNVCDAHSLAMFWRIANFESWLRDVDRHNH